MCEAELTAVLAWQRTILAVGRKKLQLVTMGYRTQGMVLRSADVGESEEAEMRWKCAELGMNNTTTGEATQQEQERNMIKKRIAGETLRV